jgi:hypothetical protein
MICRKKMLKNSLSVADTNVNNVAGRPCALSMKAPKSSDEWSFEWKTPEDFMNWRGYLARSGAKVAELETPIVSPKQPAEPAEVVESDVGVSAAVPDAVETVATDANVQSIPDDEPAPDADLVPAPSLSPAIETIVDSAPAVSLTSQAASDTFPTDSVIDSIIDSIAVSDDPSEPVKSEHRVGIDDVSEDSRPEDDDAGVSVNAAQLADVPAVVIESLVEHEESTLAKADESPVVVIPPSELPKITSPGLPQADNSAKSVSTKAPPPMRRVSSLTRRPSTLGSSSDNIKEVYMSVSSDDGKSWSQRVTMLNILSGNLQMYAEKSG